MKVLYLLCSEVVRTTYYLVLPTYYLVIPSFIVVRTLFLPYFDLLSRYKEFYYILFSYVDPSNYVRHFIITNERLNNNIPIFIEDNGYPVGLILRT